MVSPDEPALECRAGTCDTPSTDHGGISLGEGPGVFRRHQTVPGRGSDDPDCSDSSEAPGVSDLFKSRFLLCAGRFLWLLCTYPLVEKGDCTTEGCAPASDSRRVGLDGGLCRGGAWLGSGDCPSRGRSQTDASCVE